MKTTDKMREQFDKAKAKHNNAVLLFRMGNYFEAYYEDAVIVYRFCNQSSYHKRHASVHEDDINTAVEQLKAKGYSSAVISEREP
jgi:DNA mismatch repair protein MutS